VTDDNDEQGRTQTMTRYDPYGSEFQQWEFERRLRIQNQGKPFAEALHEAAGLPPPPPRRSVTNTTAEMASGDDALLTLVSLMSGQQEQAILAQEKQGQTELVESTMLPAQIRDDGRRALETAGLVFGNAPPGDPLFLEVRLPDGWCKVATNHDMWSDLHDDLGRVRARMFYKASWYDRDAHMSVEARFVVRTEYEKRSSECEWHENGERAVVLDMGYGEGGKQLFATTWQYPKKLPSRPDERDHWVSPEPRKEAQAWLAKRFPRYEDASAYWNDPVGPASRTAVKKQAAADAKRLVAFVLLRAQSKEEYGAGASGSFRRRVEELAAPQIRWISKPWRDAYLAAFMATAERCRKEHFGTP
jgi:hypothetical protein